MLLKVTFKMTMHYDIKGNNDESYKIQNLQHKKSFSVLTQVQCIRKTTKWITKNYSQEHLQCFVVALLKEWLICTKRHLRPRVQRYQRLTPWSTLGLQIGCHSVKYCRSTKCQFSQTHHPECGSILAVIMHAIFQLTLPDALFATSWSAVGSMSVVSLIYKCVNWYNDQYQ